MLFRSKPAPLGASTTQKVIGGALSGAGLGLAAGLGGPGAIGGAVVGGLLGLF